MPGEAHDSLIDFRGALKVLDKISAEERVELQALSSALIAVERVLTLRIVEVLGEDYLSESRALRWGVIIALAASIELVVGEDAIDELSQASLVIISAFFEGD